MPVPSSEPHVAALLALLVPPALPAGVVVYDGEVPPTPGQTYVVLYPDPGMTERSSLLVVSDHFEQLVQVTCVGTTARQARDVLDAVRAALVDQRPTVAGRTCWPITQEPGMPPIARDDKTRDPAINRPRFYFAPQFRIQSAAA